MRQTASVRANAPAMTRTLRIPATGLRHSPGIPGRAAGGGPAAGVLGSGAAAGGGGAVGWSMGSSGVEEDEPGGHGPEDHHAEVDQPRGPEMRVDPEPDQDLTRDDRGAKADQDAHHPA